MTRFLAYAIAISQLLGGFYAFSYFDTIFTATPFATLDPTAKFWFVVSIAIYLSGVVGALLLFAAYRAGYTLSILHQIVLIPVIVLMGQIAAAPNDSTAAAQWQAFNYAAEDAASIAIVVYDGEISNKVETSSQTSISASHEVGVGAVATLGSSSILAQLNPRPGFNYYGANIIALLSVFILFAARRQMTAWRSVT